MPTSKRSTEKNITIIGFDPGLAITGYGILSGSTVLEYGVLQTVASETTEQRLAILYQKTKEVLSRYAIVRAGCERIFFARNVTTALDVGQARGVILLAIAHARIPVVELTPLEVKQAVSGYGRASKQQLQYMVKAILHLNTIPKPDDAADALAIALATQTYGRQHARH